MANVLLIEPDRLLAETFYRAFTAAGHEVLVCASAQSAVFAADAVKPDAVVLELQLIEHSGIEFLYEFRSYPEWQNVPVILHTNVPPSEFLHSGEILKKELGVGIYLYKPLTGLRQLLRSLHEQLSVPA